MSKIKTEELICFINKISRLTQNIVKSRYSLYIDLAIGDSTTKEKLIRERNTRLAELENQRIEDIKAIIDKSEVSND